MFIAFNTLPRVETAETRHVTALWVRLWYTFNTLPRVETAETLLALSRPLLLLPLSIPYHGSRLLRRRAPPVRSNAGLTLSIPYHGSRLLRPLAHSPRAAQRSDFQYPTTGRDC